jgi:RecB family endonuclease NucS
LRIFSINGTKLTEVREQQFPLESEIQRLTEANLHDLFELDFVKSELELHGLRIDTLAFDNESKAFVIIEYKKDRNFSVVDQGMTYLNLMLNNKADFILVSQDLSLEIVELYMSQHSFKTCLIPSKL